MFQAQSLQFMRGERILFENQTFCLDPGQGMVLCGENGVGKSTFLKILAGLLQPSQGQILFQNEPIADSQIFADARFFLGHQLGLKASFTANEMMTSFLSFRLGRVCRDTVSQWLSHFQIQHLEPLFIKTFSAGQKQRLALALAFACKSPLLLLDEPTSNLDEAGRLQFIAAIEQHLKSNGIIIFASHQAEQFQSLSLKRFSLGAKHD